VFASKSADCSRRQLDGWRAWRQDFATTFIKVAVPALESRIRPDGESFQAQREGMLQLVERLRELEARAAAASARSKPLFDKRGQLLPRERLARLLDPGAPWLELSSMAGWLVDHEDPHKSIPGGGVISGIGSISGTRCVITVNDAGINAGAIQRMGGDKLLRAQDIALHNKLPFVQLIESAGANLLQYKVEGFINGGKLFYNLARLSAAGIPVVGVVHGSSTAGGAYLPGLSDHVIMVRGRAKAFLAGPPLLKAATGEIATDEELGGAEMHASCRAWASTWPRTTPAVRMCARTDAPPAVGKDWARPAASSLPALEPLYDADELAGVMPLDYRNQPTTCARLIARIVDRSDFTDFKSPTTARPRCRPRRAVRPADRHHHQQRPDRPGRRDQGHAVHPRLRANPASRCCTCRTPPATSSAEISEAPA
jgi:geranyl-CoA carboxylase beta subunit